MNQSLTEMLRYHAAHNHSPEIRHHCREMLDTAGVDADPVPPRHQAQSILTSPEQRAAYLEALGRSLDGPPSNTQRARPEQDHPALIIWLLMAAYTLLIVGVTLLYRWWP